MKKHDLFLDASALVAYFNIEDEFHSQATGIIDSREFNLDFYTADVTLLEVQYVLWRKVGAESAIDKTMGMLEAEDISVLACDKDDILNQLEIFKLHPMPSFDAMICAIMNRYGIKLLLSFDREHFDAVAGITRVEDLKALKAKIATR